MSNKSILITGGAGFIGSNLCELLVFRGFNVRCLDNLSTSKYENIQSLEKYENFEFINADITNFIECQKALKGIDFVVHLAALGSVPRSIDNPIASNENNVVGFLNILEATRISQINGFIFASSSSVYGDNINKIKTEDVTGDVLSPYALTKSINEQYAQVYKKVYDFNYIGLRFFNVFGKRQDPNGPYAAVIPKFTQEIWNSKSPVINGDGTISRDFTYVDNVTELILNIIVKGSLSQSGIYNVGFGESTTINRLFELIKENLCIYNPDLLKVIATYGTPRKGDVQFSQANISNSKIDLDYSPKVNIEQGLEKYIKWFHDNV